MNRKRVFQSESFCFFIMVLSTISFFNPQCCSAQIEMKETGSHFQDFNSLSPTGIANPWEDSKTILGWYWQNSDPSVASSYYSDNGVKRYVGKRCYGTTNNDPDRAIGGFCGNSTRPYCYGIKLHNASSNPITNISVGYTGEQWSVSADNSPQFIIFSYKITSDPEIRFTSNLEGGEWKEVAELKFASPKTSLDLTGAINGNDLNNSKVINGFVIPNINIPLNSYILLRWRDLADQGGDFGLAIDDVTVKWTVPVNLPGSAYTWTGGSSSDWSDNSNWSNSKAPDPASDVEIAATTTNPNISKGDINIKSLVIRSGGQLTIEPGNTITVSGNSTFEGTNCLILKSPTTMISNASNDHAASASFWCNGTVSGPGTIMVERYISKYTSDTDGWHFFSSPVNHPAIDSQFKPGDNDDLYEYYEIKDDWLNQKSSLNDINFFQNGLGYLVSYESPKVHTISGLPNYEDIKFTDLSFTGNRGWHLLGNPYPCGLRWGDPDGVQEWKMSGISPFAKLLNSGGTYSDVSAGESIPSMNGFFIKVDSSSNTITIPKAARTHTISDGWKSSKVTAIKKIKLVISSNTNNTFAETKIILNEKATTGYDLNYDSPYLSGMPGTPLFYSVLSSGQELSTNSVPEAKSLTFNFEFTPGLAKEYTLKAEIAEEWASSAIFILEDKLTKTKYTLNNSSSIKFSSDTIDAPGRFKLMIDIITGIEKGKSAEALSINSRNKQVYVSVPDYISSGQITVYDLLGRQVYSCKLNKGSMDFMLPKSGFYLVHVLTNKGSVIKKIHIP